MPEIVLEYVSSKGQSIRCDPLTGVIRRVKLLGLRSKNGRIYLEKALRQAIGLYEGAKVNVDHPKGDPLAARGYRDRLGVIRNVVFEPTEGLFGDLHYNPKHALAEQLAWDAEHSPENVGLSHNVLAQTKREGTNLVVESITKVQSVDLVADPATTQGLYEQVEVTGGLSEELSSKISCKSCQSIQSKLKESKEEIDRLKKSLRRYQVRDQVDQILQEQKLTDSSRSKLRDQFLSEEFLSTLDLLEENQIDEALTDRIRLVQLANNHRPNVLPQSVEQRVLPASDNALAEATTEEFVASILSR